ncbi:MAG: hypothetical protein JWN37_152 [Candidatus Nomurabacteria bacterium]|nr:hypothetical protein [Candidatus Nomurabacteria bacterium]
MKLKILLILSIFVSTLSVSFGEIEATINISPSNPTPNSSVNLTLSSYSFDVNTSNITWIVSGKTTLSGLGAKNLTIKTGGLGTQTTVTASVVAPDGSTLSTSVTIVPSSIDLLFESPESEVPLFYDGRSLPGEGAGIRVVAIPNISEGGALVSRNRLSYSWYLNDELLSSASGLGKQSVSLKLDYLNDANIIKVAVSSPGGLSSQKSITVYPHDIIPALYTYDDILGVDYSRMIERRFETTKDFTLALEPYYLSTKGVASGGEVDDWLLDGLPITPIGGRLLSLSPAENSYGAKNLAISISNIKRNLQKAETSIDLIFDTRK